MSMIEGHVVERPDFFISKNAKKTAVLKFRVALIADARKKVPVICFGKLAEDNEDMQAGEHVFATGEFQESTYQEITTNQLTIGYKGRLRRTGKGSLIPTASSIPMEPSIDLEDYLSQQQGPALEEDFQADAACWAEPFPRVGNNDSTLPEV